MAYVIDLVICYGTVFIVAIFVGLAGIDMSSAWSNAGIGLILILVFAAQWLYFFVLEAVRGTTPGKAALGLLVLTTEGRPIGARASAIRNLLRGADALPTAYAVGIIAMTASPRFQRLGDLAAGTMV